MTDDCDHELPRKAAGVPDDVAVRLVAARATIKRLRTTSVDAERLELAAAYREVVALEVALAGLRLEAEAPAADDALKALEVLVARAPTDGPLRRELCAALLHIATVRRTAAEPADKVDAEVRTVEDMLEIAEREPILEDMVAAGLSRIVRSGQFQTDPQIRRRSFAAGDALLARFSDTAERAVAVEVARGLEDFARMIDRSDPLHTALRTKVAALRAI